MASKTLLQLVDRAIMPALLLLTAKVVGTVVANYYFGLAWDLTPTGLTYFSQDDYLKANSYSSLVMFLVVFLGLVIVFVKARFLDERKIPPRLTARLASLGWQSLVLTSFQLYSRMVVWLAYGWLTTLVLIVSAYFHLSYLWLAELALALTTVMTLLLVWEVERGMRDSQALLDEEDSAAAPPIKVWEFKDVTWS